MTYFEVLEGGVVVAFFKIRHPHRRPAEALKYAARVISDDRVAKWKIDVVRLLNPKTGLVGVIGANAKGMQRFLNAIRSQVAIAPYVGDFNVSYEIHFKKDKTEVL